MEKRIKYSLDQFNEIMNFLINYVDGNDQEKGIDYLDQYIANIDSKIIQGLLSITAKISNHHCHSSQFYQRIEQILLYLKAGITSNFTNFTLFSIFKRNKRVLLILLQNDMIIFDTLIFEHFKSKPNFYQSYTNYFSPEIENETKSEEFEQKRKEGENDNYICSLIRNDSIDEFVVFVTATNEDLSSKVPESIFETNVFLLKNDPTLIEYAVFFGSTQILNFLLLRNVKYNSKLWYYAIHSNNPDIIHILESLDIGLINGKYKDHILEAIKCFHNDIANYWINNFISEKEYKECEPKILKYHNFQYIVNEMINIESFKYLCRYGYFTFVNILLESNENDSRLEKIFNYSLS
ncbi:hypothetical protein M9Y10_025993 [Tritrichomonas musculus]|uniref:DUF3447 domain-containing protein n=1 Tax=Tritrichomonas musculus TaxID=1915356 RepID=A0ABR2H869_9EUKA